MVAFGQRFLQTAQHGVDFDHRTQLQERSEENHIVGLGVFKLYRCCDGVDRNYFDVGSLRQAVNAGGVVYEQSSFFHLALELVEALLVEGTVGRGIWQEN